MEHPKSGEFYYHFKHDDRAYMIIGMAVHTETEEPLVIYKPLYKGGLADDAGVDFYARPLVEFTDTVSREGKTFKRFTKIEDEDTLSKLKQLA